METLRGFPQFLIAAVHALQCNPDLQVVITGRDRRAYSYDAPSHDGSWKQHLLEQLEPFEGVNGCISRLDALCAVPIVAATQQLIVISPDRM